jgi:hypothetical protein
VTVDDGLRDVDELSISLARLYAEQLASRAMTS